MTEIEAYINRTTEIGYYEIELYFRKKYRGQFYVDMKVCAAKYLRDNGLTLERIAEIIYGKKERHDTIHLFLKRDIELLDNDVVCKWKEWIFEGLYPYTYGKDCKPDGVYESRLVTYKLRKR